MPRTARHSAELVHTVTDHLDCYVQIRGRFTLGATGALEGQVVDTASHLIA